MNLLKKFYEEEEGMGTIEIVMIIAALMCIALLFKDKLFAYAKLLLDNVFDTGTAPGTPNSGEVH